MHRDDCAQPKQSIENLAAEQKKKREREVCVCMNLGRVVRQGEEYVGEGGGANIRPPRRRFCPSVHRPSAASFLNFLFIFTLLPNQASITVLKG